MLVYRKLSINSPKLKIESSEQLCKKDLDLKNCESKIVGSRCFPRSKYLSNYWHTIVMTGVKMKPPK